MINQEKVAILSQALFSATKRKGMQIEDRREISTVLAALVVAGLSSFPDAERALKTHHNTQEKRSCCNCCQCRH